MSVPIQLTTQDSNDVGSFVGPYELSSPHRLYIMTTDHNDTPKCFKSTNNGLTWVVQNAGNGPPIDIPWDLIFDGNILYVSCNTGNTTRKLVSSFSFATDLWGASSASGPFNVHNIVPNGRETRIVKVGGDFWMFTNILSTINNRDSIAYDILVGGIAGAWGGVQDFVVDDSPFPAASFNFLHQAFIDTDGLIHVIYRKAVAQAGKLYHKSITILGVQGTEDLMDNTDTSFLAGRSLAWVNPVDNSKHLIIPFYTSNGIAGYWDGTPYVNPVWTFVLVDTISRPAGYTDYSSDGGSAFAWIDIPTGFLYFCFATQDPSLDHTILDSYFWSRNIGTGGGRGTWSTPVELYNHVTNPQPWPLDSPPTLWNSSFALLADGNLGSVIDINTNGLAYLPPVVIPPPTEPLVISCNNPPAGQVGVPY